MKFQILTPEAIARRNDWIREIAAIGTHFGQDTDRLHQKLLLEVKTIGADALIDHLRLCGAIPEAYAHDSTEEKLYSKYTDMLLHLAFRHLGLNSVILTERADAADVEVVAGAYSFVADAKAFRLSRTAKNQKDFKVQAMHGWKRGKSHALVVCPLYQLPARTSQIYQQAVAHNVCVFSYSHLCVLIGFVEECGTAAAESLLHRIFTCFEALSPAKDAGVYWTTLNRCMLEHHPSVAELWRHEKLALLDSISAAKEEALTALAREREAIMRMDRDEAVQHLIQARRLHNREAHVRSVSDNALLSLT